MYYAEKHDEDEEEDETQDNDEDDEEEDEDEGPTEVLSTNFSTPTTQPIKMVVCRQTEEFTDAELMSMLDKHEGQKKITSLLL
jgi:hypothetical protein